MNPNKPLDKTAASSLAPPESTLKTPELSADNAAPIIEQADVAADPTLPPLGDSAAEFISALFPEAVSFAQHPIEISPHTSGSMPASESSGSACWSLTLPAIVSPEASSNKEHMLRELQQHLATAFKDCVAPLDQHKQDTSLYQFATTIEHENFFFLLVTISQNNYGRFLFENGMMLGDNPADNLCWQENLAPVITEHFRTIMLLARYQIRQPEIYDLLLKFLSLLTLPWITNNKSKIAFQSATQFAAEMVSLLENISRKILTSDTELSAADLNAQCLLLNCRQLHLYIFLVNQFTDRTTPLFLQRCPPNPTITDGGDALLTFNAMLSLFSSRKEFIALYTGRLTVLDAINHHLLSPPLVLDHTADNLCVSLKSVLVSYQAYHQTETDLISTGQLMFHSRTLMDEWLLYFYIGNRLSLLSQFIECTSHPQLLNIKLLELMPPLIFVFKHINLFQIMRQGELQWLTDQSIIQLISIFIALNPQPKPNSKVATTVSELLTLLSEPEANHNPKLAADKRLQVRQHFFTKILGTSTPMMQLWPDTPSLTKRWVDWLPTITNQKLQATFVNNLFHLISLDLLLRELPFPKQTLTSQENNVDTAISLVACWRSAANVIVTELKKCVSTHFEQAKQCPQDQKPTLSSEQTETLRNIGSCIFTVQQRFKTDLTGALLLLESDWQLSGENKRLSLMFLEIMAISQETLFQHYQTHGFGTSANILEFPERDVIVAERVELEATTAISSDIQTPAHDSDDAQESDTASWQLGRLELQDFPRNITSREDNNKSPNQQLLDILDAFCKNETGICLSAGLIIQLIKKPAISLAHSLFPLLATLATAAMPVIDGDLKALVDVRPVQQQTALAICALEQIIQLVSVIPQKTIIVGLRNLEHSEKQLFVRTCMALVLVEMHQVQMFALLNAWIKTERSAGFLLPNQDQISEVAQLLQFLTVLLEEHPSILAGIQNKEQLFSYLTGLLKNPELNAATLTFLESWLSQEEHLPKKLIQSFFIAGWRLPRLTQTLSNLPLFKKLTAEQSALCHKLFSPLPFSLHFNEAAHSTLLSIGPALFTEHMIRETSAEASANITQEIISTLLLQCYYQTSTSVSPQPLPLVTLASEPSNNSAYCYLLPPCEVVNKSHAIINLGDYVVWRHKRLSHAAVRLNDFQVQLTQLQTDVTALPVFAPATRKKTKKKKEVGSCGQLLTQITSAANQLPTYIKTIHAYQQLLIRTEQRIASLHRDYSDGYVKLSGADQSEKFDELTQISNDLTSLLAFWKILVAHHGQPTPTTKPKNASKRKSPTKKSFTLPPALAEQGLAEAVDVINAHPLPSLKELDNIATKLEEFKTKRQTLIDNAEKQAQLQQATKKTTAAKPSHPAQFEQSAKLEPTTTITNPEPSPSSSHQPRPGVKPTLPITGPDKATPDQVDSYKDIEQQLKANSAPSAASPQYQAPTNSTPCTDTQGDTTTPHQTSNKRLSIFKRFTAKNSHYASVTGMNPNANAWTPSRSSPTSAYPG